MNACDWTPEQTIVINWNCDIHSMENSNPNKTLRNALDFFEKSNVIKQISLKFDTNSEKLKGVAIFQK